MRILFFGDSITDMFRNRELDGQINSYGVGYVRDIAGELYYESQNYEIIDRGISGNRSIDLYARLNSDVIDLAPDVLTILVGVNDVWHKIMYNNGVDLKTFEETYSKMIKEVKEKLPKTKIILMEPFFLEGSATKEKYDEFLSVFDYAKVVENLAKEHNVNYISLQKTLEENAKRTSNANILYDGVHPAPAGAKTIAKAWLKFFEENIK